MDCMFPKTLLPSHSQVSDILVGLAKYSMKYMLKQYKEVHAHPGQQFLLKRRRVWDQVTALTPGFQLENIPGPGHWLAGWVIAASTTLYIQVN